MLDVQKILSLLKQAAAPLRDRRLRETVTKKGEADFVTASDLAVQSFLQEKLRQLTPDYGFMGEENGMGETDGATLAPLWILDPIDGTTNFMRGFGLSAISLGLCVRGEAVFGAVYNPFTEELFHAVKGEGAYLNGERIHCRQPRELSDCIAIMEFNPYRKKEYGEATARLAADLFMRCQDIRVLGCASLSLCAVAAGRADIYIGRGLKPWDHAAADVILTEAGASVTTPDGTPPNYTAPTDILAVAGNLRDEMFEVCFR